jgi:hypothetical protein
MDPARIARGIFGPSGVASEQARACSSVAAERDGYSRSTAIGIVPVIPVIGMAAIIDRPSIIAGAVAIVAGAYLLYRVTR